MKNWFKIQNDKLNPTYYQLEEYSWWVGLVEWLNLFISMFLFRYLIGWIPIPFNHTIFDKENWGFTTWKDYYGNLGQLYHAMVYRGIANWCDKKKFILIR